mmetsp:Transcript_6370/g.6870  ORF Transcript_6370/g.6870 Transcript_6370/m.6870 type:complete len:401 (+) Transcript_6370:9-1211(+)
MVTLLLMNALANEALPIFLDKLVPSYIAVILSVTIVLIFGEIIPSAVFTGPNQLAIASKLAPLVRFIMIVLTPLAWPIAKLLDKFLHEEDESSSQKYDRNELSVLVRLQYEAKKAEKLKKKKEKLMLNIPEELDGQLLPGSKQLLNDVASLRYVRSIDEVNMIEGALQMQVKTVGNIMHPWHEVYSIPSDLVLTERNIVDIYSKGHSRLPIYWNDVEDLDEELVNAADFDVTKRICGIFKVRQLAVISAHEQRALTTVPWGIPYCVPTDMNMVDLLNLLQSGKGQMAIVCLNPALAEKALKSGRPVPQKARIVGLVTLEDCIEELIQEEIYDEYDKDEKLEHQRAIWAINKWKDFVKKRKKKKSEYRFEDVVEDVMASKDEVVDEETSLLIESERLLKFV